MNLFTSKGGVRLFSGSCGGFFQELIFLRYWQLIPKLPKDLIFNSAFQKPKQQERSRPLFFEKAVEDPKKIHPHSDTAQQMGHWHPGVGTSFEHILNLLQRPQVEAGQKKKTKIRSGGWGLRSPEFWTEEPAPRSNKITGKMVDLAWIFLGSS